MQMRMRVEAGFEEYAQVKIVRGLLDRCLLSQPGQEE
jgi:hypothetical protein